MLGRKRAALDDVMTRIPADQATYSIKVRLAEFILKAAADRQTTYDGLFAASGGTNTKRPLRSDLKLAR
jgi:hypothetical protein